MPIQVNNNSGNPIFTPQLSTGRSGLAEGETPPLVDLSDVNKIGLNDNDVLVYDGASGKFKPVDIDVINDNDAGTF
tara:strand:+ start:901 stop:1128 length:228 start_codon:yes stop_codon:yes gene_type:complete